MRGRVLAMADARGVVAHLVTDQEMTAGRHTGCYRALCGAVVLPGSLVEQTTDRYCRGCVTVCAQRAI